MWRLPRSIPSQGCICSIIPRQKAITLVGASRMPVIEEGRLIKLIFVGIATGIRIVWPVAVVPNRIIREVSLHHKHRSTRVCLESSISNISTHTLHSSSVIRNLTSRDISTTAGNGPQHCMHLKSGARVKRAFWVDYYPIYPWFCVTSIPFRASIRLGPVVPCIS